MWLSLGDAERRVAHGLARTPQMAGTAGRTVGQGEEGDLGFSLLPGITLDRPGKGEAERSLCCPRFGRAAGFIGVEEVREACEGLALQTLLLGVRSLAHAVMDGHARCSRFAPPFSAQLGAPGGWPA